MAGREKKTKKLLNASRESPVSASKQSSILSFVSPPPQEVEGAPTQEPSTPVSKKVTGKLKNPKATKINTLRGRNKTKANFKLIQTLAQQAVKPVMRRGRPPLKRVIKTDTSPEKSEESLTSDDSMAKKRGRKKVVVPVSTEITEEKTEGSDATKPAAAKETESKKTVIKNVPKKVVKKKQILVAQKGLTKRKVLLSKKILKTDTKQVDPKVLKKNLTAKLKSVTEKLEAKKTAAIEKESKANTEAPEVEIPVSEIKKEPCLSETPPPLIPDSRSSSPRTGTRKRNSADITISKAVLNDVPSSPGMKSPYSTRSERSSPLTLTPSEQSPKVLRNGRQRKPKGLKNTLLSETVGQEFNKRRRLLSDTKIEQRQECLEVENKIKRFRSCSRDGIDVSKCSDVTETDLSTCEGASIDIDNKVETKDDSKTSKSQPIPVAKIKKERISIDTSPSVTKSTTNTEESKVDVGRVASPVGTRNRESVDNDNNNTDEKSKTDGLLCDKLGKPGDDSNLSEKNAEKSLILDNMSKAFNEYVPTKKGNIRRSARQRKSTIKAKEHEETLLAEQSAFELEIDVGKLKSQTGETPDNLATESTDVSKSDDISIDEAEQKTPVEEQVTSKITTKTFYGDPKRLSTEIKKVETEKQELAETETPPPVAKIDGEADKLLITEDSVESIKLQLEEDEEVQNGPVDNPFKKTVECSFKKSDPQDIGKLIDKLRHFEEQQEKMKQDKIKQEELSSVQQPLMVSNDTLIVSKVEQNPLKELPSTDTVEKPKAKENVVNSVENTSSVSIVKKDQIRKSFEIDLPSSVTLIKKTATAVRKHSTSSKEGDSVTVLDKSSGKDLTMELRKSIDMGILSLESSMSSVKTSTINTGNGQSLSISLKPQTPKELVVSPITNSSSIPVTTIQPVVANPVTALISLPTPSPLMITPIPMSNNVPVSISSATVIPKLSAETHKHVLTIEPSINTAATETTMVAEDTVVTPKESIPQIISVIPKSMDIPPIALPSGISIKSAIIPTQLKVEPPVIAPQENSEIAITKEEERLTPVVETKQETDTTETKQIVEMPPLVKTPPPTETQPTPLLVPESPVSQKQKQDVLRAVGLISLKEADEAKQEKEKQKEIIKSTKPDGYTGTLKTVIKLNRTGQDKKSRSPLKMTLQKNKSRTTKVATEGLSADSESDENPSYTIHKEISGAGYGSGTSENHVTSGGHRKTHYSNRFNIHDHAPADPLSESTSETSVPKEAAKNLVIPEKASSFGIHPGRLCLDQCFYCGGKFGLFDTPCHVAQIKSSERQKKILDNEEKLTVDSCLCDACYRHVDRRANCPGYRRRVGGGGGILGGPVGALVGTGPGAETEVVADGALCHATMCRKFAPHTLRRKWLVKMRSSIAKVVQLDLDYPGLHTIPLCEMHYQAISHLMICGLCKGGLSRNHVHYINQEYKTLNPLLAELGLPVVFKEKPAVCKLCRYFCSLLCKPPSPHQTNKRNFLKTYKRRLLIAHNIDVPEESETEAVEEAPLSDSNKDVMLDGKDRKKNKNGKSKSKKSSELRKSTDENHSHEANSLTDGSQGNKITTESENNKHGTLEEDIESLISTNTIHIPNSNSNKAPSQADAPTQPPKPVSEMSDSSDLEMMVDLDPSAIDKQSELQLLLQKCNIPSSTILQKGPISSLTQKNRNILKVHNATAISKNTQLQKVLDKNARRIQKLGQIITKNTDLEKAICSRLPNREEFTLEAAMNNEKAAAAAAAAAKDLTEMNVLKNLALNDECTIESLPMRQLLRPPIDKSKWQLSNSFSQIKKNLKALSQVKKHPEPGDNFSNPVRRLETNPSISVRELFPGEEEMNLQCSIEFGNVKGITPDGWEKCSSIVQYDADTKRLWQELQKPYGNQSSFLRHLILLEKYFRNGDLILSQNANCNAVTYSESVQNRLRSYDNVPTGETVQLPLVKPPSAPPVAIVDMGLPEPVKSSHTSSLIDFRKHKPSNSTGKSLLKTNQMQPPCMNLSSFSLMKNSGMVRPIESLLPTAFNHAKIPKNVPISLAQINQSLDPNFNNYSKADKNILVGLSQLEKMNSQLHGPPSLPPPPLPRPDFTKPSEIKIPTLPPSINIEAKSTPTKADVHITKAKVASLPPELIAINADAQLQRKSIENVLKNIQQLAKGSGSSTPVSKPFSSQTEQTPGLSPIPATTALNLSAGKLPDIPRASTITQPVVVPDQTKKGKISKQWRPTLIPITDESKSKVAKEVLYQTADGRRLPSLVQVMSGGKPYHITIQDYNKMCIMRREKLQQMHRAELAKKPPAPPAQPASVYDFTLDPIITPTLPITPMANKPSTPPNSNVASAEGMLITSLKSIDQPIVTIPSTLIAKAPTVTTVKNPELHLEVNPVIGTDVTAASILKNVGLKNVTIAPVTTSHSEVKPQKSSSPPANLISATPPVSTISIPSIISQLGPSISVTTESGIKINTCSNTSAAAPTQVVSCVQPITITSQAVLLPKIPKSLTVIPQTRTPPRTNQQTPQEP